MDGVYFIILKEIFIKENLKMIKQMDMENITIKMEEFIQVIGLTIINMVLVQNYGVIQLNIMENIIMVKKKGQELFFGQINQFIKENGKIILLKDMEFIK